MSPIASDLSYEVLQRRRGLRELTTPQTDQCNGLTQLLVQRPVIREAVAASNPRGVDLETWERARMQRRIEGQ